MTSDALSVTDLLTGAQLAVGSAFTLALAKKLQSPFHFVNATAAALPLHRPVANIAVLLLIPLEFVAAATHLSGYGVRWAAPLTLLTIAAMRGIVGQILLSGASLPCFCMVGTPSKQVSATNARYLNALLALEIATIGGHWAYTSAIPMSANSLIVAAILVGNSFWLLGSMEIRDVNCGA